MVGHLSEHSDQPQSVESNEDVICEACLAAPEPENPKFIRPADMTLEALNAIGPRIARFRGAGPRHQLNLTRFVGNYAFDRKATQECSYSGHRHFLAGFLMYSKCGLLLQLGADCTRHVTNLEEFNWLQQQGRSVKLVELQLEAVPGAKRRILESVARGRRCVEQREALRKLLPEVHDLLIQSVANRLGTETIRRRGDRYLVSVPDIRRTQKEVESGRDVYRVQDYELLGMTCFDDESGISSEIAWCTTRVAQLDVELEDLQANGELGDPATLELVRTCAESITNAEHGIRRAAVRAEEFWTERNLVALSYPMFELSLQRKLNDREEPKRRALVSKLATLVM
jgi:hypothetical protein